MAFDANMIGDMFQATGAAMAGQTPQYNAQKNQERQQKMQQALLEAEQLKTADKETQERTLERQKTVFKDSESALNLVNQGRWDLAHQLGQSRMQMFQNFPGVDSGDTAQLTEMAGLAAQGDPQAQTMLKKQLQDNVQLGMGLGFLEGDEGEDIGTEGRFFNQMIGGFSDQDQQSARRVKAGLDSRAMGSSAQTIAKEGISEMVGDSEAKVRERIKFGEMSGTSRAKAIDKGFEKIQKIDKGMRNIGRAIDAARKGAGSGALEKRFPSIMQASIELDQIADSMALDVIGSVTLGAISEAELDLAKQVALPRGLKPEALIEHLQARSAAQGKLRAYLGEQIDFLDQGGTVAGFLRSKKVGQAGSQADPVTQAPQSGAVNWSDL